MKIIIRNEEQKDYKRAEEVAREAFWNLYFPGCHEHYVLHKLREHNDYIKELSFIIEIEGSIEGGIYYTRSKIVLDDGSALDTISFGPVFISPKFHRQGLGKKLITHSLNIAKKQGYCGVLTLGYPYHYELYGFRGGKQYNISMPDGNFYKGLLVLPLIEDAFKNISGYAEFSDVFEVTQEDVDAYDQLFPLKEKKYQKSQDEYAIASEQLDN